MSLRAFSLSWRTGLLFCLLFAFIFLGIFCHRQINRLWAEHLLLKSKGPRDEFFDELAKQPANPVNFLNRCWATGKITHRQLVAAFLRDRAATNTTWFAEAEPLVIAGTTDADTSVRELALATLEARKSPWLFECARKQLGDVDPLVRQLGLDYLRNADFRAAIPVVIRLLDDPDLRVVARAEGALRRWSGEDYGVRVSQTFASPEAADSKVVDPSNVEKIRLGVEQRKNWWRLHEKEYPSNSTNAAFPGFSQALRPPAPNFTLRDINGKSVSLSAFKGKVALLNFWATWCTACFAEIPDLIALQNKIGARTAIVGVALDGAPDPGVHEQGSAAEGASPHGQESLSGILEKVRRAAKTRGINYTVLSDPKNAVGGQFNGGELPTTVIFDAEGRVRRRFIGERSLKVFEAMVTEAEKPPPHL